MFKLIKTKKNGTRLGRLTTPHGILATPFFMPDATRGFVKLTNNNDVVSTKTKAMVVNTFHLYLQPGLEVIKKAGGIHKFMNWHGPLLSDSGGFQVFSLIHKDPANGRINDEKAVFRSPLDGSWHEFTPEKSIQIQFDLGTDMMVCLDDCPPNEFSRREMEKAVNRTIAWASRCRQEYDRQIKKRRLSGRRRPLLFAVVQGGMEVDLRERCASELAAIGFDGYGFGARPIDAAGNFLEEIMEKTAAAIPESAPRFALGVGTPEDIRRSAALGWDMFDCVIPSREGRHGKVYAKKGKNLEAYNIGNSRFSQDFKAVNAKSSLSLLRENSRAYLHHLFRLGDPLGQNLASLNNLEAYQELLADLRQDK
jgi:queuine tRNA-ribosyltransferase